MNKLSSLAIKTDRHITIEEIRNTINRIAFKIYCKDHGLQDVDLDNYKDDVHKFTLDYMAKYLGISKERSYVFMQTHFSLLSFFTLPFEKIT